MSTPRDKPVGYEQITSLSAAASLTPPATAVWALIVPETQAVRWRDDGTNPTTSVGLPLDPAANQSLEYTGDLSKIRFIEQIASAKLNVAYYG